MINNAIIIVRYENNPVIFLDNIINLSELSKIYIYDNSKIALNIEKKNNIYYFHDASNGGLAKAINHCIDVALLDGKEIAVYFDQDSTIDINLINRLVQSYSRYKKKYKNLFALGPQPTMPNGRDYPIKLFKNLEDSLYSATEIITSGITFELQTIKDIGYFDENLFLDMIDFEICWRAREKEMLIAVDKSIKMPHEVGIKTINLPFKVLPISSPIRNYYQMRNMLYLALYKYKKNKITILYYILRRFINIIINMLFADKKMLRLKYNYLAIKDAISKRMGKIQQ